MLYSKLLIMVKKYHVALSFASENREYVRAVAINIQAAGIKKPLSCKN